MAHTSSEIWNCLVEEACNSNNHTNKYVINAIL